MMTEEGLRNELRQDIAELKDQCEDDLDARQYLDEVIQDAAERSDWPVEKVRPIAEEIFGNE